MKCRLDDLGDVLEIEAQRIDAVNNTLTEAGKDTLDLLPDRRHVLPEFLVRVPQMLDHGRRTCTRKGKIQRDC